MRPSDRQTDAELIQRAQQGSLDAFEGLVRRYQDRLLRFLMATCRDRSDAEDALQEAFAAAWRYRRSYRPDWAFSTWLYRIARRQAGRIRYPRGWEMEAGVTEADPTRGQAERDQCRDQLWPRIRRKLPKGQALALWLYYGEDLPVKEIARVMARPASWVKVNLHRARARLAREVDRDLMPESDPEIPALLGETE